MAKFRTIYAGRYINDETGVEIVKVPARRLGRNGHRVAGWIVTAPTLGVPDEIAFGRTKSSVLADAEERVEMVRPAIAKAYVEAVAEHVERAAQAAEAVGAPTWRADSARRMVDYAKTGTPGWLTSVIADVRRMEESAANHRASSLANDAAYRQNAEQATRDILPIATGQPEQVRTWCANHGIDPQNLADDDILRAREADHAEALAMNADRVASYLAVEIAASEPGRLTEWMTRHGLTVGGPRRGTYALGADFLTAVDADHAEALAENAERRIAATIDAHESADMQDAARTIESVRIEDRAAAGAVRHPEGTPEYETYRAELTTELGKFARGEEPYPYVKADAARTIAATRAPEGERCGCHTPARLVTSHGLPKVPDSLTDDAGWDAYRAALPAPTAQESADVLAEFGDPYAAMRADAVQSYKNIARTLWRLRADVGRSNLHKDVGLSMRSAMRTLRGVIGTYDKLTAAWRVGVHADANRDTATQTF